MIDAGKLEHLLSTLVPSDDVLIKHAHSATDRTAKLDQRFPAHDRMKAILHCWLACQSEPGRPFGTALKAHCFRHDSEQALRFVSWFRRLYGFSE